MRVFDMFLAGPSVKTVQHEGVINVTSEAEDQQEEVLNKSKSPPQLFHYKNYVTQQLEHF